MTATPKTVIVLPTDTKPATLAELRKAGFVPVLCNEPEKVQILTSQSRVSGDDLLMSAMWGVRCDDGTFKLAQQGFFQELHRRMQAREKGQTP